MHLPGEGPPVGSGYFARYVGISFFIVWVIIGGVWYWGIDFTKINPLYVLEAWLLACSVILVYWGQNRINHARNLSRSVGQDTINMVVAIVGVTFAIAAIILKH
jgi:hypothetical protein